MLNLERIGSLTAELTANLVRSIVLPIPGLGWKASPNKGEDKNGDVVLTPQGNVVLLGGGPVVEDVVVELIHMAGGRKAQFVVVNLADDVSDGETAAHLFRRFGVQKLEIIQATPSAEGEAELPQADLVYLVAPDPQTALTRLAGSPLLQAIAGHYSRGKVLVGAAGVAPALCEQFVVPGAEGPQLALGLGLIERLIIAPTAETFPSLSSLLTAVGAHVGTPYLGIGIDSRAAVALAGGEARVIGEGRVTFLDGRDASHLPEEAGGCTSVAGLPPASADGQICGLRLHQLVAGYGLNLRSRRPTGPSRQASQVGGGI